MANYIIDIRDTDENVLVLQGNTKDGFGKAITTYRSSNFGDTQTKRVQLYFPEADNTFQISGDAWREFESSGITDKFLELSSVSQYYSELVASMAEGGGPYYAASVTRDAGTESTMVFGLSNDANDLCSAANADEGTNWISNGGNDKQCFLSEGEKSIEPCSMSSIIDVYLSYFKPVQCLPGKIVITTRGGSIDSVFSAGQLEVIIIDADDHTENNKNFELALQTHSVGMIKVY